MMDIIEQMEDAAEARFEEMFVDEVEMKPTTSGYYWYKQELVAVRISENGFGRFYRCSWGPYGLVGFTEDADWGPMVLSPCDHRQCICDDPPYGPCTLESDGKCKNE